MDTDRRTDDSEATNVIQPVADVYGWVEPGTGVMFKAFTSHGDPVELNLIEARAVVDALLALITQLEVSEHT